MAPGVLAAWASNVGIPLVHVSTDYVFDGCSSRPYKESDATNPMSVYGASKLAGENAIRDANVDALIIRTSWIYSAFGNNFVKTMLRLAMSNDRVRVVSDQIGNPTSALDVANAIHIALAQRESEGRFGTSLAHFAGHGSASWYDVACQIFATSSSFGGPLAEVEPITTAQYPTKAARPKNSRLDSSHFEKTFGYRAPAWRRSLVDVVKGLVVTGRPSFDSDASG